MTRRPRLTPGVLRGLELAFRDPSSIGALFGVASLPKGDEGLSREDRRDLERARRYVARLVAWRKEPRAPGELGEALSEHRRRDEIDRKKAELLDEVMRPGASMTPAEASKRYAKLAGREARELARSPSTGG